MIRRFVCAAALASLATVLTVPACSKAVTGTAVAAAPIVTDSSEPDVTTTGQEEPSTTTPPPSTVSPSYPTSPSTTTTSGPPVTIAKRKAFTTPPACATLLTPADISRVTGTTAGAEPEDKGFCSYTLTRSGSPTGVALVVLTPELNSQNTTPTTFEGNTAFQLSTVDTTCDLRIALTDDQSAPYRVLWVSLVLTGHTEPVCTTVDKLARQVFAKLPGS